MLTMTAGQRATDNFRVRLSRDRLCADLFGENIHGRAYTNRQVKLQIFIAAFIFNAAKTAIRFMPSFCSPMFDYIEFVAETPPIND